MTVIIRMPKLSPTMEEGIIAKWHVQKAERVEPGQLLLEVATDKATVEHQTLDGGMIAAILVAEGQLARVNQPIALLATGNALPSESEIAQLLAQEVEVAKQPSPEAPEPLAVAKSEATAPTLSAPALSQPRFEPFGPIAGYDLEKDLSTGSSDMKASPYARWLAAEKGVDLTAVKGSGPDGRIIGQDIEQAPAATSWGFGWDSAQRPQLPPGSFELEALTPMRKAIATRLQESKSFIPHFYLSQQIDASSLAALHGQLKAQGLKVSLNDLMIRACALALRRHPRINSGFHTVEQRVIRFQTIDIAVAVALEGGLITPIIYHADYKSVGQIAQQVRKLVSRAASLAPHEYQGGSFTLSNLGMFGTEQFQAIINPPQAAILAVGAMVEKPVVRQGRLEVGQAMMLTLSCDHRVIDGADAARFLASLKQLLEAPAILLV